MSCWSTRQLHISFEIQRPFGVIVTTNMFGDILSDLASELSGGLGVAGSLNLGPRFAVAQAQHGSAPDIADQGIANPISLILSLAMLLRYLGEARASEVIETAIAKNPSSHADTGFRWDGNDARLHIRTHPRNRGGAIARTQIPHKYMRGCAILEQNLGQAFVTL